MLKEKKNDLCKQKKSIIFKLGLHIVLMNLQENRDISKEQIDENIKRWTLHKNTQETCDGRKTRGQTEK